jgi:lipid-binding SYLF domain-containing protein
MRNDRVLLRFASALLLCALLPASPAMSADEKPTPEQNRAQLAKEVRATVAEYKKTDPGIDRFFKKSAGYVVFPRAGKVGLILGAGGGQGEVFERGRLIGTATMTIGSIGLQAGVQEFSEIIFFQDRAAVQRFKESKFEFTANASAVIVKSGASASADYRDGVAVFTKPTGGAMVEASLGGQKFSFTPKSAAKK